MIERSERHDHPARDFLDILARGYDDASTLVSEDNRLWHRINLVSRDHISMAYAGRNDSDQRLVATDRSDFDRFRDERAALVANNSGL